MKIFYYFLLLIAGIGTVCQAEEAYDIETLPYLRTKQYSIKPHGKIVVFSAPRTGSSLVYNVLRFLFEDSSQLSSYHNNFDLNRLVLKTHKFAELDLVERENIMCVFTLRNPLEAAISNYRICLRKTINNKAFAEELVKKHKKYLLKSEHLEHTGTCVARLKYEDFVDRIDSLFEMIETSFHICIDPQDKELMKKGYSKENICSCTKNLAGFKDCLPISGFHGHHVSLGKYDPPAEFLYWLNIYLKGVKPLFQPYGY